MKIEFFCTDCGSTHTHAVAWMCWDTDAQTWNDYGWRDGPNCADCGGKLEEREMHPAPKQAPDTEAILALGSEALAGENVQAREPVITHFTAHTPDVPTSHVALARAVKRGSMVGPPIMKTCPHCGSHDVIFEAGATWSTQKQDWQTFDHDHGICQDCEHENMRVGDLIEVLLSPQAAAG
ncbi:MAG: hypothetical protein JWM36_2264 [Hyphomicrobiales bacterium]|nr:hypothetical protein [Hyphomicrobiales bacterium]